MMFSFLIVVDKKKQEFSNAESIEGFSEQIDSFIILVLCYTMLNKYH